METIVPNKTQMEAYLKRGLTQKQIAEQYESDTGIKVSRSAIGMAIERYGLRSAHSRGANPKGEGRYEDTVPWTNIRKEHRHLRDVEMLRYEGRRRRGGSLTDRELRQLQNWLEALNEANAVVTYNPDSAKGFWWVARTPEDGMDIVRRPA